MSRFNFLFLALLAHAGTGSAQPAEPPPSPVRTDAVVFTEIVPAVPIAGTVHSRNDVQITAAIDGHLLYVVEPGTVVGEGDILVRMDTAPLELQLAELQAQATRARAQLAFLEKQLARENDLARNNQTAATQRDQTESNRDIARSDLSIAQSRISQLEDQIARATITARFGGVVTGRDRREGETVGRGAVLARLSDTANLEVRVLAPLHHAGRVNSGDELRMIGFESSFVGIVRSVIPPVDGRSQAMELRIDLPADAARVWTMGQLVSVSVPLRSAKNTLAVDRDALILRQDGTFVYRVTEDGKAERISVTPGESVGALVAVEGDLAEGDEVIVRGAESLSPGQPVSIIRES